MIDIQILGEINEWWVTGRVRGSSLEPVPRKITPEIEQVMEESQIILLEGPRRVGKTSILFHLIQGLLDRGIPSKSIIYASLDDPLISKGNFFEELIDLIETHLTGSKLQSQKARIYLFLDELTHLKEWELYLKRYYDQKYPFKFIVSSSAASFLVEKGRESLVGRLFRFHVTPFSFSEFLRLKSIPEEMREYTEEVEPLWELFFETGDGKTLFHGIQKVSRKTELRQREIGIHLHQFLLSGGFPEFLQLKGERAIRQYFPENIIERVVYHDIPEAFHVADRALLQDLLLYSIFHSGSIININEIAASYGATRQTVSNYLYYLQASMLIRLLEKYAKTEASRLRAFRKIYTVDTGLYIHLQRLSPAQIDQRGLAGQLAEIVTFSQLTTYLRASGKLFYFRERDLEVDFITETPGGIIPVEVKYRGSPKNINGIRYGMERFKAKGAVVVTKDLLKFEDNILFIPLRLFLS